MDGGRNIGSRSRQALTEERTKGAVAEQPLYSRGMKATAVTVGVPVRDLDSAIAWYQRALELGDPDQIPMPGIVEFDLGAFWLQLFVSPEAAGSTGLSLNVSVESASGEHARLAALGLTVSEFQRFEGAVEYFELTDLDGNTIAFVTELV